MSNTYEIPLQATPQTLSVMLASATYNLRLAFQNVNQGGWTLDLMDASGNSIVCGVPLVTGTNLLGQYGYLGLGFALYVATDGDVDAVPTFANLGQTAHLYAVQ